MRVFKKEFGNLKYGGTASANYGDNTAHFAFDGKENTKWISVGATATTATIERSFSGERIVKYIFFLAGNIDNLDLQYWNGSTWASYAGNFIVSEDGLNALYEITGDIPTTKIKIECYTTTPAGEEKELGQIYLFGEQLGRFDIPPERIDPSFIRKEVQHKLYDGKSFVYRLGESFSLSFKFKAHIGQADIDLIQNLIYDQSASYIWINDSEEWAMAHAKFKPFRFNDILKMVPVKTNSPKYFQNYFGSGLGVNISLVEVE